MVKDYSARRHSDVYRRIRIPRGLGGVSQTAPVGSLEELRSSVIRVAATKSSSLKYFAVVKRQRQQILKIADGFPSVLIREGPSVTGSRDVPNGNMPINFQTPCLGPGMPPLNMELLGGTNVSIMSILRDRTY